MKSTTAATLVLALSTLIAGQAMAADQVQPGDQVAVATQAAAQPVAQTKAKDSADVFADLDKVKKW